MLDPVRRCVALSQICAIGRLWHNLNFTDIFMDFAQVYFESDEVLACIVTCGGLCPGLNTVIREIVCGLHHMYGVRNILGIDVSCTVGGSKCNFLF